MNDIKNVDGIDGAKDRAVVVNDELHLNAKTRGFMVT